MNESPITLPQRGDGDAGLIRFADTLLNLGEQIGFKVSARGWCYQLEGFGLITKAQFDHAENIINKCRERGYLPIDFTADEEARQFSGIETPETLTPLEYLLQFLEDPLRCEEWYTPNWWEGEEYYIQMVVEKIDLKTLFEPVCRQYHIPIATSRGWSSMLQRAEYARRFKAAENEGLSCALLYCGDHDPDGLRISEFLHMNLFKLEDIIWMDGNKGYDPRNLIINRFGLNADFIEANRLTWIDNLITSSKRDLASPSHPNYHLPYVQDYLAKYGARKCEANALVVRPAQARDFVRQTIEGYISAGALGRFTEKHEVIKRQIADFRQRTHLTDIITEAIETIEREINGE